VIILGRNRIEGNIRPTGNRVLLSPLKPLEKVGSIHIPEAVLQAYEPKQFLVVAVGPGVWRTNKKTKTRTFVPLEGVKPGDIVEADISIEAFHLNDGSARVIVDSKFIFGVWERP